MNRSILLVFVSSALAATSATGFAQSELPAPPPSTATLRQTPGPRPALPATPAAPELARFDLDFPGGTPQQLVDQITKASGRPLNAIIPEAFANFKLPALRMTGVTTQSLFDAMSRMVNNMDDGFGGYSRRVVPSFRTTIDGRGITDASVWVFAVDGFDVPRSMTRYYLLTPYLKGGLTVDDITTAIQTGWKLGNITSSPKMSFHKETSLLIVVGTMNALETVELALRALDPVKPAATKAEAESAAPAAPKKS